MGNSFRLNYGLLLIITCFATFQGCFSFPFSGAKPDNKLDVVCVAGGSVILECSFKDHLNLEDVPNLHWRKADVIVFDMVEGNETIGSEYKDRVNSFAQEYQKGNFSIKLTNLRATDAGTYSCILIKDPFQHSETINLSIETPEDKGRITSPAKLISLSIESVAVLKCLLIVFVVVVVVVVICCICCKVCMLYML